MAGEARITISGPAQAAQNIRADVAIAISEVTFEVSKRGTPAQDFTVDIRNTVGGKPAQTSLGTGSIAQALVGTARALLRIAFAGPIQLAAGVTYALVARTNEGVASATDNYDIQRTGFTGAGGLFGGAGASAEWLVTENAGGPGGQDWEESFELCPTCHSRTGQDNVPKRVRGTELPGVGEDLPDDITSITPDLAPLWTEDPVLTFGGLNGPDFVGAQRIEDVSVEELQEIRANEEEEAGLSEIQKTDFSDIIGQKVGLIHINELRESVEKILNITGSTLEQYFSRDAQGNIVEPGPNDTTKDEWTDVNRGEEYRRKDGTTSGEFTLPDGNTEQSPSIPFGTTVRGLHLEDLRRPILLGIWREFWSVTTAQQFFDTEVDSTSIVVEPNVGIGITPGEEKTTKRIDDAFDIFPTDDGNIYPNLVDELTWRPKTRMISIVKSFNPPGFPPNFFVGFGSSAKWKLKGSVETSSDLDVLALKSNAKTFNFVNTFEKIVSTDPLLPFAIFRAGSDVDIRHNWISSGPTILPNESPTVVGEDVEIQDAIPVNKDTHFKFLHKAKVTAGDFLQPVDIFGFDNGNYRQMAAAKWILTFKRLDTDGIIIMTLFFTPVIFSGLGFPQTLTAPLSGATFQMGSTSTALAAVGNLFVEFLATTEVLPTTTVSGEVEFDMAINIDDLLTAYLTGVTAGFPTSDSFDYTSHKILAKTLNPLLDGFPEGEVIVENPDGTPLLFETARYSTQRFLTNPVTFDPNFPDRAPRASLVQIDDGDQLTTTLTAIRIENDDTLVRP